MDFHHWILPNEEQLKLEFMVEHMLKNRDLWKSEKDFLISAHEGKIISLSPEADKKVSYRSNTKNKSELLQLLRGYRSWGTFRTEKTVDAIYEGFIKGHPMVVPIVIEFYNGRRMVFSGNTRLDIAFQLGITPKVLLVKAPAK